MTIMIVVRTFFYKSTSILRCTLNRTDITTDFISKSFELTVISIKNTHLYYYYSLLLLTQTTTIVTTTIASTIIVTTTIASTTIVTTTNATTISL